MDKPHSPEYSQSDEVLAAFTDELLSTSPDTPPPPTHNDPELAKLEQTVLRLRASFPPVDRPPPEAAGRIRQNLVEVWPHIPHAKIETQPAGGSWMERVKGLFGWNTARRRQRTMTLAFSGVAALTLILTLWLSPATSAGAAAATSRMPGLAVFAFLLLAAGLAFFWDRFHK